MVILFWKSFWKIFEISSKMKISYQRHDVEKWKVQSLSTHELKNESQICYQKEKLLINRSHAKKNHILFIRWKACTLNLLQCEMESPLEIDFGLRFRFRVFLKKKKSKRTKLLVLRLELKLFSFILPTEIFHKFLVFTSNMRKKEAFSSILIRWENSRETSEMIWINKNFFCIINK